jgi:hypothetical protein
MCEPCVNRVFWFLFWFVSTVKAFRYLTDWWRLTSSPTTNDGHNVPHKSINRHVKQRIERKCGLTRCWPKRIIILTESNATFEPSPFKLAQLRHYAKINSLTFYKFEPASAFKLVVFYCNIWTNCFLIALTIYAWP